MGPFFLKGYLYSPCPRSVVLIGPASDSTMSFKLAREAMILGATSMRPVQGPSLNLAISSHWAAGSLGFLG